MCGIAGFLAQGRRPAEPRETLRQMAASMRRRGPDADGLWLDEDQRVGFAHRRLAVLDPTSASDQPMHLPEHKLSIVYNGELYNYKELREELRQQGHVFRTEGDTEVLLHLYQRFGPHMLPMLRGMYAFVLWDGRRNTLIMARDPLGIKPLYYCTVDGVVYFSSQVKTLRPLLTSEAPDPAGRAGFLLWGSLPEPYTFFRDIRCVPSGAVVTVQPDSGLTVRQGPTVADLLAHASTQPIAQSAGERQEVLREALLDSLKAHMTADVPVGLLLSAGLGSSAMAGLLSELPSQPDALTLGFSTIDLQAEADVAAATAKWYGLQHHMQYFGPENYAAVYEDVLEAMDQPTIDGINTYMVSRVAKHFGFKVVLSGVGGDEIFGGNASFHHVPQIKRSASWADAIPGLGKAVRVIAAPAVRRLTSPKLASLLEYGATTQGAYLLRRGLFMPWELKKVIDPGLAAAGLQILESDPLSGLYIPSGLPENVADRASVHMLEMTMYMRHQLLRDSDWAGMANSVEVRVPLADWKLLTTLAPYIVRGAFSKQDMAVSPQRPLPPSVLNRIATPFNLPVRDWIQSGIHGEKPKPGLRGWALHLQSVFSGDAKSSSARLKV